MRVSTELYLSKDSQNKGGTYVGIFSARVSRREARGSTRYRIVAVNATSEAIDFVTAALNRFPDGSD